MTPIREIADKHGIPLLEDAAHALGTQYLGDPVGRLGTGVFSLQAIKNVTTAEGGVICTDDDNLAERTRRLRFHGLAANAFDRQTNSRIPNAEVIEPGFKYNLPDMNACLALGQMQRLDATNAKRERLAQRYLDAFAGFDLVSPLRIPDYFHRHAWHLFVIRIDIDALRISRDRFTSELRELGIGTGLHFRAIHQHRYYRTYEIPEGRNLPNTEWNSERLVTLPLFPGMQASDVDRVVDAITSVAGRFRR
jgi:UDP-4-amino-4-deoxy-L-arabinose-oxoglutarate aminotransferase